MRVSELLQSILHNYPLVLIALLTAIFETLGLEKTIPTSRGFLLLCVSSLWHMAAGDTTLGGSYRL